MFLNWVEIQSACLAHNARVFKSILGKDKILAPPVKANAYGHGLVEASRIFLENGADFLCVNALYEAEKLRQAGIKAPLLIIGYVPLSDLGVALAMDCDLVVYNEKTLEALKKLKTPARLHLKIETGNHRQGIERKDLPSFLERIRRSPHLDLVGASTHFADLEDHVNSEYALSQLKAFHEAIELIEGSGFSLKYKHCANSAATLLLQETHFNFARPGIGMYGLWPSSKTRKATEKMGLNITLKPALSWKTRVAQVKEVKKGDLIGYGCTYKMPHNGHIAVLPVGYYDGYVRLLGNRAQVLIGGQRVPVLGRICMNMMMVDISSLNGVRVEEEVVLMGRQGSEQITAQELGEWSQTIHYEVLTRIHEQIPRVMIP